MPSAIGLFWRSLVEDGHVAILHDAAPSAEDMSGLRTLLRELDRDMRLRLAFTPPALDLVTAQWACVMLYRACQFLMFRHVEAEVVDEALSLPAPGPMSPATIYSADLALRHLGEVLVLADRIAPKDVLTIRLRELGQQWPLSSVGIADLVDEDQTLEADPIARVLADDCLRMLYVDRVIAFGDKSRLAPESVARLVRTALGPFPELNPEMAAYLAKEASHEA
jgi:hypothetical protein